MPAKSKKQQRLFGMVHAAQKGDIPMSKLKEPARKLAKTMKPDKVKKYAKTKHKGLPDKVKKEELLRKYIRNVIKEVLKEYRKPNKSNPFEPHMFRIAVRTLQMASPIAAMMGGPSPKEAEEILRSKFGFTDEEIEKVKSKKIRV